jgi:hypothetical protein
MMCGKIPEKNNREARNLRHLDIIKGCREDFDGALSHFEALKNGIVSDDVIFHVID